MADDIVSNIIIANKMNAKNEFTKELKIGMRNYLINGLRMEQSGIDKSLTLRQEIIKEMIN